MPLEPRDDLVDRLFVQWAAWPHRILTEAATRIESDAKRIAELEAHCLRLGQGGAERYWEGRYRDEAVRAETAERALAEERERRARFESILNTPSLEPFAEAAVAESKHQIYRWGEQHDATKTAWDWFWLAGYLTSKAAHAALAEDWDKAKHHTITAAAMLANWHRHICDHATAIRSGKPDGKE